MARSQLNVSGKPLVEHVTGGFLSPSIIDRHNCGVGTYPRNVDCKLWANKKMRNRISLISGPYILGMLKKRETIVLWYRAAAPISHTNIKSITLYSIEKSDVYNSNDNVQCFSK